MSTNTKPAAADVPDVRPEEVDGGPCDTGPDVSRKQRNAELTAAIKAERKLADLEKRKPRL